MGGWWERGKGEDGWVVGRGWASPLSPFASPGDPAAHSLPPDQPRLGVPCLPPAFPDPARRVRGSHDAAEEPPARRNDRRRPRMRTLRVLGQEGGRPQRENGEQREEERLSGRARARQRRVGGAKAVARRVRERRCVDVNSCESGGVRGTGHGGEE